MKEQNGKVKVKNAQSGRKAKRSRKSLKQRWNRALVPKLHN